MHLLLIGAAFALTSDDTATLKAHLATTSEPCAATRYWAESNLSLTCGNVPFSVPDAICYTRLADVCTYNDDDGDGSTADVDCDDSDAGRFPGNPEIACDLVDQDCDTLDAVCTPDTVYDTSDATAKRTSTNWHYNAPVAAAGDVDGDGHDDLLVGAPSRNDEYYSTGGAYLVRGPFSGTAALDATDVFMVDGDDDRSFLGDTVAAGEDLDGDGWLDIAVGGPYVTTVNFQDGGAFVFTGPFSGTVHDSAAWVSISSGSTDTNVGTALDMSSDSTGDGQADLLVVASGSGAYLLAGPDLAGGSLTAADAVVTGTWQTAAFVGDLDGDGTEDLALGCYGCNSGPTGAAAVVFGPISGTISGSAPDLTIVGASGYVGLGGVVVSPGDVDGDGLPDLGVGARLEAGYNYIDGSAYLFTGVTPGTVATTDATARIIGQNTTSYVGETQSLAGLGDLQGDGYDELVVGSVGDDAGANAAGGAYLFFGPVTGLHTVGEADVGIVGTSSYELLGTGVFNGGDTDADGLDDLVLGDNLWQMFVYSSLMFPGSLATM